MQGTSCRTVRKRRPRGYQISIAQPTRRERLAQGVQQDCKREIGQSEAGILSPRRRFYVLTALQFIKEQDRLFREQNRGLPPSVCTVQHDRRTFCDFCIQGEFEEGKVKILEDELSRHKVRVYTPLRNTVTRLTIS